MDLETKTLPLNLTRLEIKAVEGEPVRISGYLSTYGDEPDSYGDRICRFAFDDTVATWKASPHPMPLLWQHSSDDPIGHWSNDLMRSDDIGLFVEGSLAPGNSKAQDVAALLRHGSISGLSIGFRTRKAKAGPKGTRTLEAIDLFEGSVVVNPANRHARVTSVKSSDWTIRQFEAELRDHFGFSRRRAETIARDGFKAADRDDQRTDGDNDPARDEPGASAELHRLLQSIRETGRDLRRA